MSFNNIGICKNTGYTSLISRLVTFTLFTLVDKDYLRIARMKITRANFVFNASRCKAYSVLLFFPHKHLAGKIHVKYMRQSCATFVNIGVLLSHRKLFRCICVRLKYDNASRLRTINNTRPLSRLNQTYPWSLFSEEIFFQTREK